MPNKLEYHPVAEIFPLMEGQSFQELVEDIKLQGLLVDIWTYQNKIIDGRNRYRACIEANVKPRFQEWSGEGDLVTFVVGLNDKRRHMNESQRAMVAGKIANLKWGEKQRKTEEGPKGLSPVTNEEAAKLLNVGERSVRRARRVQREAIPEVTIAVEKGEVNLVAAERIAAKPKPEQPKLLEAAKQPPKPRPKNEPIPSARADGGGNPQVKGKGIQFAHEAIAVLKKIPIKDALRDEGLSIVARWIKDNR
jgi:hypothetical protein